MAKFFLLVFTILLSLSLGLFVGQNYLLNHDKPENISTTDKLNISIDSLSLNFKTSFNKLMDKIFANDEVLLSDHSDTNSDPVKNLTDNKASEEQNDTFETPSPVVEESVKTKPVKEKQNVKPKIANEKSEPALTLTEKAQKGWVIQIAAFQDMNDAQKVEQQVNKHGYPIHTYKTEIKNQTWYRVNLGPFQSVTEATSFKQTNKVQEKFKGAFVRQL